MIDYIIGGILVVLMLMALRSVFKKTENGGCAGCSGCSGGAGCPSQNKEGKAAK